MKNKSTNLSWVEILVSIAVALIIARYIWAKELIEFENSLFETIGISITVKYFITVPLVTFLFYRLYKREVLKAKIKGNSVVGLPVLAFVGVSFIVVIWLLVIASQNA
jgi:hypothetical protein